MAAPYLWKRAQVAAKIEASEGTPETLAAADADIMAENVSVTPEVPYTPREVAAETFSKFCGTVGGPRLMRIGFDVKLAGSGTNDVPASFGKLLRACGIAETINATTDVDYDPATTGNESITLAVKVGDAAGTTGKTYQIHGARGNPRFQFVTNEPGMISFEFLGVYSEPADAALFSGITREQTCPAPLLGGTFTLDADALKFKTFEMDLGNVLTPREAPASAEGVFSVAITDRVVTGSIDPEDEDTTTHNYFAIATGQTQVALALAYGGGAGNNFSLSAGKVQYEIPEPGERDGIAIQNVPLRFLFDTVGDDEFQFKTL